MFYGVDFKFFTIIFMVGSLDQRSDFYVFVISSKVWPIRNLFLIPVVLIVL